MGLTRSDFAASYDILAASLPLHHHIAQHLLFMQRSASRIHTSLRTFSLAPRTQIRNMHIHPVPVRDDVRAGASPLQPPRSRCSSAQNYAYIIQDGSRGVFVDPFDVPAVQAAAKKHGVEQVMGCITTHRASGFAAPSAPADAR